MSIDNQDLVVPTPRQYVTEAAATGGTWLWTEPPIAAAAALLGDWLAVAADRHTLAIVPSNPVELTVHLDLDGRWRRELEELARRLAHAALDTIATNYRLDIASVSEAIALLDAAVEVLRGRGVDTVRDGYAVAVPRTPASPPWGPDGQAGLAIECTDDGWDLAVDVPSGPSRRVIAPHDTEQGAAAVVDLALAIVAGDRGNPFAALKW